MRKRVIALCLSAALMAALPVAPAAAAFPDVTDPQVQEAVEVLKQLEVINGKPDGTFDPSGTFDRAAFCKMALTILGRGEEASLNTGRVIFSDVTASHWALGYINAAATAQGKDAIPLVRGKGDGSFAPNDAITCGEAVTILMRCLGYSDDDVGSVGGLWYAGYMAKAKSVKLLRGLETLNGSDTLTRAQAALLFENLLYTPTKGAADDKDVFLQSVLGGSVKASELVLEVRGKALPSGGWALKTDKASYVTFRSDLSTGFQGRRCKLVADQEGNILSLQVDEDYTTRALRIRSAEARYLLTESGEQVLVPADTPLWRSDKSQSAYSDVYKEILGGSEAILCYDKTDALVSVYLMGGSATAVTAVAGEGARPFEGAWEGQPTAVYKNGVAVSLASVQPYDVGTFEPLTGVLELSDRKLTGVYEDASPSPVSPNTVTVMGCAFPVLDCALKELSAFSLGDPMTLLLDAQGNVAGVVSPAKVSAQGLGVATITKGQPDARGYDTFDAQVTLSWGPVLKGKVRRVSQTAMDAAPGKLCAVTSSEVGYLTLSTPVSDPITGDWDVARGAVGSAKVAPHAAVYDKISGGHIVSVGLDAVTLSSVPLSKIDFLRLDNAGSVDTVVLRDVTGDGYTYGVVSHSAGYTSQYDYANASTTVTNGGGKLELTSNESYNRYKNSFLGLAPTLSIAGGLVRVASDMPLTARSGVHRAAFDLQSKEVVIDGVTWPLCANIDKQCYNAVSETWFASLDAALAYSAELTVYYDRTPEQGGKVRMVVIE